MANTIILKKSSVAGKVPAAGDLQVGELAVNLTDKKIYSKDSSNTVIEIGGGAGSGTVTSVGITAGTGVTSSGGPITTSGNITVGLSTKLTSIENLSGAGFITQNGSGVIAGRTIQAGTGVSVAHGNGSSQDPVISLATAYGDTLNPYASKTANFFLAAPNGSAGVPTFRAIVAADIPTLNQNTTGTASNVTGTVAIANGGTGATTAANALTNLGAYAASNPSGYVNTAGARSALSFTAGSGAYNSTTGVITIPTNTNQLTNGAGFTTNTGTVTSVSGTGTVAGISLSGTVTTSGSLSLGGTFALPNGQVTGKMIYNNFTATAGQTTFTTSNTYTSGKIDVFANGVRMVNGSDVTVTSGTSVVFATGLGAGTTVDLVYPI